MLQVITQSSLKCVFPAVFNGNAPCVNMCSAKWEGCMFRAKAKGWGICSLSKVFVLQEQGSGSDAQHSCEKLAVACVPVMEGVQSSTGRPSSLTS